MRKNGLLTGCGVREREQCLQTTSQGGKKKRPAFISWSEISGSNRWVNVRRRTGKRQRDCGVSNPQWWSWTPAPPRLHLANEVYQNAEKHKQPDIRWSSVEHYQIRWDNMVLWDVRASSSSRANLMNSGVSLKLADVDDQVCVCVCVSINSCSCEFGSQSWFNRHLSPSCDRLQSDSVFTFSMDIM